MTFSSSSVAYRHLKFIVLILLGVCMRFTAHSQVPQLVNYQGRVAVDGLNFNGPGSFKFALVDGTGATTFWSNDGTSSAGSQPTVAVPLTVANGLYSVMLGDTMLSNMAAIPASVWANADVRLRVWFNDGMHGFQLLSPDQRLAPNGYLSDGAVTAAKIAPGGTLPALDGSALTNLNASSITSGTLPQSALPSSLSLGSNSFTFTLADPGAQPVDLLAWIKAQPVTPQQFGALADGMHDDTQAIQAALDTGRSVFLPEGIYVLTDSLAKGSIGQWMRGAGQNRTILRQTTAGKNAINFVNPSSDGNDAHQWHGEYSGGGGVFLQEIGDMTIEGTDAGSGIAIYCDGKGVHIGDYFYLHDLWTYRFGTHLYFDSVAQLRFERVTAQNGASMEDATGTGIYVPVTSAVPNSFIMEGVSVTGFAVGVDVSAIGGKFNFGDVVMCNIGVQISGGECVIDGGHFESCTRYLNVGSTYSAEVALHGVNLEVEGSPTLSPIKVDHGSVVVGAVSGSAPDPNLALVELTNESDFAQIQNVSNSRDNGAANPAPYEYFSQAFGKSVRFPIIDDLKADDRLPTASASFRGKIFRIINGAGLGDMRLVMCAELADGSFAWRDLALPPTNGTWNTSQTVPAGLTLTIDPPASGGGLVFAGSSGHPDFNLSMDWERYVVGDWSLNIGSAGNGLPTKNLLYVDGATNRTTIGHDDASQPTGGATLNVEGTLSVTGQTMLGAPVGGAGLIFQGLPGAANFNLGIDWQRYVPGDWSLNINDGGGGLPARNLLYVDGANNRTTIGHNDASQPSGIATLNIEGSLNVTGSTAMRGTAKIGVPVPGGGLIFAGTPAPSNYDLSMDWERYIIGDWSLNIGDAGHGLPTRNILYVDGAGNHTTVGHNDTSQPTGQDTLNVEGSVGVTGHVTIGGILKLKPQDAPDNPQEGWIYCDAAAHHLYVYLGGNWRQIDQ
jgi:hypothetical protein